ncbi:MAG: DUF1269 domain-containing protein [Clostridia bacterium]|nr:DUF1269 domain-containing protein [Clostridia bacterium]
MYNIVGALFTKESDAREAMAALTAAPQINGTTIYQISLVKRVEGVLKLCDNFTSSYLKSGDTVKGGLLGGLIGILTGPIGMLLGSVTGALAGKIEDLDNKDDSAALIEQAAQKLEEGDIALIALVDETNEAVLDHALVGYNTIIVRYDANVIAKELEEAEKMEAEMARQAREALRSAQKKDNK